MGFSYGQKLSVEKNNLPSRFILILSTIWKRYEEKNSNIRFLSYLPFVWLFLYFIFLSFLTILLRVINIYFLNIIRRGVESCTFFFRPKEKQTKED